MGSFMICFEELSTCELIESFFGLWKKGRPHTMIGVHDDSGKRHRSGECCRRKGGCRSEVLYMQPGTHSPSELSQIVSRLWAIVFPNRAHMRVEW
jgi:hypothetical protein